MPLGDLDHARLHQFQAVEEPRDDVARAPDVVAFGQVLIQATDHLGRLVGIDIAGRVGNHQETPRRYRSHQAGHGTAGLVQVGDVIEDGQQNDGDRPGEVEVLGGLGKDRGGVTQVGVRRTR